MCKIRYFTLYYRKLILCVITDSREQNQHSIWDSTQYRQDNAAHNTSIYKNIHQYKNVVWYISQYRLE